MLDDRWRKWMDIAMVVAMAVASCCHVFVVGNGTKVYVILPVVVFIHFIPVFCGVTVYCFVGGGNNKILNLTST